VESTALPSGYDVDLYYSVSYIGHVQPDNPLIQKPNLTPQDSTKSPQIIGGTETSFQPAVDQNVSNLQNTNANPVVIQPYPQPQQPSDIILNQPNNSPPKKRLTLPLIIGLIIFLLLCGGFASYHFIFTNSHKPINPKTNKTTISASNKSAAPTTNQPTTSTASGSNPTTSNATVTYTESYPADSSLAIGAQTDTFTANCGATDCFDQRSASCTPTTTTITSADSSDKINLTINGPTSSGCGVTIEDLSDSESSSLDNLSMTCTFNKNDNFTISMEDATGTLEERGGNPYSCTGPLEVGMKALGQQT
jgi:hypothetical protein